MSKFKQKCKPGVFTPGDLSRCYTDDVSLRAAFVAAKQSPECGDFLLHGAGIASSGVPSSQ